MLYIPRDGFTQSEIIARLESDDFGYDFSFEHLNSTNGFIRTLDGLGLIDHSTWKVSDDYDAEVNMQASGRIEKPSDFSFNFYQDRIRIYVKIEMGKGVYASYSQCIFRFASVKEDTDELGATAFDVVLADLSSLLEFNTLSDLDFKQGDLYTVAFETLLSGAGLRSSEIIIITSDKTLPANIDWPRGTPRKEILHDLMIQADFIKFADENGRIVLAPRLDLLSRAPGYVFTDDSRGLLYMPVTRDQRTFDEVNYVELTAAIPDSEMVLTGKASNTNRNDEGSIPNVGYRPYFEDVEAADQATIDRMAADILLEKRGGARQSQLSTQIMPFIRAGDVIDITHSRASIQGKHFIRRMDFSLAVNESSLPTHNYTVELVEAID